MNFNEHISISGYKTLNRLAIKSKFHIAHHNKGRGCRLYLCGCGKSIKIGSRFIYPGYTTKRTSFQRRIRK